MGAKIRFKVSNDNMTAVMLVGRPSEDYTVTFEEIENALAEEGIVFGICVDRIESAVKNQSFLAEIPCANGEPPVPGKNGEIKFVVQTERELRPRIRDDGTVDYHDMGLINEVDKGRLLCRRTRPVPGVDGTDIYGAIVPFRLGLYPEFPAGEGTEISPLDDTKLIAARNGFIKFKDGIISVPETFVLDGDVNNGTGNVKFKGDIIINGCVREGFNVISEKNITINGAVEGGHISAGGFVSVRDGFTGMTDGYIYTAGDVDCKYLQNAVVKCGGNLTTEYALNSYLTVGGDLHAETGRGTIAGGEVHAIGSVCANNLGSDTYITTKIVIDDLPDDFWVPVVETNPVYSYDDMQSDFDFDDYEPFSFDDEVVGDESKLYRDKNAKIMARSCAYPEVRLQVGVSFYDVDRELKCTKFELKEGEIIATPIF